ncbi:MAG: hypothetical protein NTV34_12450 [Proteobacteria bacterium]|nr:hypothetical protein [Pseudomonadota bacterium]
MNCFRSVLLWTIAIAFSGCRSADRDVSASQLESTRSIVKPSIDIAAQANLNKLQGFPWIVDQVTKSEPGTKPLQIDVAIETNDVTPLNEMMTEMKIEGDLIADKVVFTTISLADILRISMANGVKQIRKRTQSDSLIGAKKIGLDAAGGFTSRGDSIINPVLVGANYTIISIDLIKAIDIAVERNLNTAYAGFVKFTREKSVASAQKILPGIRACIGPISTFDDATLRSLMVASKHKDVVTFERARPVQPHPSIGTGN